MERQCIFWVILVPFLGIAQDGEYPFGGRADGLAGAVATLDDAWSVFHQPAGIATLDQDVAMAGYRQVASVPGFRSLVGGYVHAADKFNWGVSFFQFGDQWFREQRMGLTLAHRLDQVSLGVQLNHQRFNVATVGQQSGWTLDFGGQVDLLPFLSFGAGMHNLNQGSLRTEMGTKESLPVVMRAGISIRPMDDQLVLNMDTEKDLDHPEVFRAGVEYRIVSSLAIRTGIRTRPTRAQFGLGWSFLDFLVDYAYGNDPNLGDSHSLGILYQWQKR